MMLSRTIFCTAVLLATLAVILLALFSQLPKRKPSPPGLDLSLYIQQPNNNNIAGSNNAVAQPQPDGGGGAFIFHRMLTEGPENTSRVVGKAQRFIIPAEHFAKSGFNIIYLTFYTPQFSGSLSVEAKHVSRQDTEELTVMGGTGSFAFARGVSVFAKTTDEDGHVDQQSSSGNVVDYATYHVKLQLRFPNQSQTVLG
ncbi:hypothetical protein ACFX13_032120 [Malus domestica]|uniref:Dirigent protein n=1 Tax=Malus domestica TaxID=3750 RepID=A0A498K9R4_MALDO|nr:dirigent protein 6-like [Malus domestica]RXI02545.1 hypothetical protein DVH24_002623 [Malus domestica]